MRLLPRNHALPGLSFQQRHRINVFLACRHCQVSRITEEEVLAELATAEYEVDEIWNKPELILPEIAHMTAFKGSLGNPLLCPKERLYEITPDSVLAYRQKFYHPDKIVAAFVGVDTNTAVEMTNKYLGDMPS